MDSSKNGKEKAHAGKGMHCVRQDVFDDKCEKGNVQQGMPGRSAQRPQTVVHVYRKNRKAERVADRHDQSKGKRSRHDLRAVSGVAQRNDSDGRNGDPVVPREDEMKKSEVKQLRGLMAEAKALQEQLNSLPVIVDSVTGSLPEHPWTAHKIKVQGIDNNKAEKIKRRLERKLEEIQNKLEEIEEWLEGIDDAETRAVARLYFVNGMTQGQIANELGYSRTAITSKISRLFENCVTNDI